MAQAFLIFDFGSNEDAVQQARHRLEGWKQAFRLGTKVQFKFERKQSQDSPKQGRDAKEKAAAEAIAGVRMVVRLDFSNHEKHLFHNWLERIPAENPFQSSKAEVVRPNEESFEKVAELYNSLD